MSKTFSSIIMCPSSRFLSVAVAVLLSLFSLTPLAAQEKKSQRLEDGSRYRYPLLDGLRGQYQ